MTIGSHVTIITWKIILLINKNYMENHFDFGFSYLSVIQFCSTAFAYYAQATAAQEIFGHTLQSLRGIKYLYK
jgi:hypothetical protein